MNFKRMLENILLAFLKLIYTEHSINDLLATHILALQHNREYTRDTISHEKYMTTKLPLLQV